MNGRLDNRHFVRQVGSRWCDSPSHIFIVTPESVSKTFGRGDISAVGRLVEQKLEEYAAPAKMIIYSSSIVTTQKVSRALDFHAYYREMSDAAAKDEIRKA